MKNKKLSKKMFLGMLLLLGVSLVSAVWIYTLAGSYSVTVGGEEDRTLIWVNSILPLTYNSGVADDVLNTQQILVNNTGEVPYNATFEFQTTKTDVENDSCEDFENDIVVRWVNNGFNESIVSGEVITFPVGETLLHVITDIKANSCPQFVETNFTLIE